MLRPLTEKAVDSPVLRGFILDALNVFSFWVCAQCCMHGTVNSRGCPCSTLFRLGLIYVCQATAELGTCWWPGEAGLPLRI